MKKLSPKINSYCTYCKVEGRLKVRAWWVVSNYDKQNRACDDHKDMLPKPKKDDYYTEADYQTWMRL